MPSFTSIEAVMASYPSRFYPERARGVEGVIQFILTGSDGAEYHLVIHDQQVEIGEGIHPDATVTVTAPADSWLKVNNGEASPTTLLMQGKLKVSGSLAMAAKFQSMFKPGREL